MVKSRNNCKKEKKWIDNYTNRDLEEINLALSITTLKVFNPLKTAMRSSNYFSLERIKLLNCSQIPLIIQFSRSLIFILANDWGLQSFQYRNSSASNCQQRRTKTGNPVADQILVLKETPITVVLPQLTCLEWITSLPISDISRCGIISSSVWVTQVRYCSAYEEEIGFNLILFSFESFISNYRAFGSVNATQFSIRD